MVTPEVRLIEQLDKRLGGPSTWRAQQVDWKKPVIVQIAAHGRIEEDVLDAFLTTCALAQEVETARIAHIHDFGVYEDKLPFVVVEALEGRTLEQVLKKKRRLGMDELAPIARQLAEGLDGAHELEVHHHRLTPSDIVLRKGADVDAIVRGFAIGLLNRPSKTDEFLSPELFADQEADHRADLWSLAAIIYRALIGRPAIEPIHRRPGDWKVELPRIVVSKALREELEPVFAKALAAEPGDRFDTAEAMVEATLSAITKATGGDAQFQIVEVTAESVPPATGDDEEEEELEW
jgi:serine/threonine-protein kinase